ncbi:glycoside hydrolase family 32 protein [Thalassotalea agariperforans]
MKNSDIATTEHWRPFIHFTPEKNWLNDPNGMVYFDGVYHLFYQYNPAGDKHANMHWGHAKSTDLVNWQHADIGIYAKPEELGYVFSGGAVVDVNNTSGLGDGQTPPLVATFTHHSVDEVQVQSIAYSQDGGNTWQEYVNNPVIANPGVADFRDPKVIWDEKSKQWVMTLAVGQEIHFYRSDNLIEWQLIDKFGEGYGAHGGVWECPDLFPLTTACGISKWVLLVSLNPGGPNKGSATQYFIGEFDGNKFISDHTEERWLDYGPDNYAGVTWDGLQSTSNKRIFVAWMSNWDYANELPTNPWRGAMTLPRELTLVKNKDTFLLANLPIEEIRAKRNEFIFQGKQEIDQSSTPSNLPKSCAYEITWQIDKTMGDNSITLFNSANEKLVLSYVAADNLVLLDRTQSGWTEHGFGQIAKAPLKHALDTEIVFSIIIDQSTVEVFTEDGLTTLTSNIFPKLPYSQLKVSGEAQVGCFTLTDCLAE